MPKIESERVTNTRSKNRKKRESHASSVFIVGYLESIAKIRRLRSKAYGTECRHVAYNASLRLTPTGEPVWPSGKALGW